MTPNHPRPTSPPVVPGLVGAYRPTSAAPDVVRRSGVSPWLVGALVVAVALVTFLGSMLIKQRSTEANVMVAGTPLASIAATLAALPACTQLFASGKVIEEKKVLDGCKAPGETIAIVPYIQCASGRKLFQLDATTGAPKGYGFGGGKFRSVAGDIAADAGYAKAFAACSG